MNAITFRHDLKRLAVPVIVVFMLAVLVVVVLRNFAEAQVRSLLSRKTSDLRTISTALESYYADHAAYPRSQFPTETFEGRILPPTSTFGPELTTPVAYLWSIPTDCCPGNGKTFRYREKSADPEHAGYIIGSFGPDEDYDSGGDLQWQGGMAIYNPLLKQPTAELLCGHSRIADAYTYDPTNGTYSGGDIWRVKQ